MSTYSADYHTDGTGSDSGPVPRMVVTKELVDIFEEASSYDASSYHVEEGLEAVAEHINSIPVPVVVGPEDYLVVNLGPKASQQQIEQIRTKLRDEWPDHRILVVTAQELAVMKGSDGINVPLFSHKGDGHG